MLNLNLQFFGEEDDSLDFDSMVEEFEKEWTEEDQQEETIEETEQEEEIEEVETQEEPPAVNDEDTQKRNAAFADMRRQAQEAQKYQAFVHKLAEEHGISPEDVLARFEEQRLEQEAEKQNVPVDVIKRLQTLEQENLTVKESAFAERFNSQVDSTVAKHGATNEDIQATFQYALDNGIDFRTSNLNFEAVHRMAHLDTIITKEVEKARQTDFENKKKRQQSATIPNGNSVTPNSDELTDEFVDQELARMGIRI